MATEEQKVQNQIRLAGLMLTGLTGAVWDMVGESAYVFSKGMGKHILSIMEKEMGLEIAGASPLEIGNEIGRLFADEFGFVQSIEVEELDSEIVMKVHNCVGRPSCDAIMAAGVEHPFICPVVCLGEAILARIGGKARIRAVKWEEGNGSIIRFELF
ncbi:MAG: hypothetical protein SWK90_05010 [Chloroflexota bacterium]|nr:hypothetical protein [Chloroflexota bacterium]